MAHEKLTLVFFKIKKERKKRKSALPFIVLLSASFINSVPGQHLPNKNKRCCMEHGQTLWLTKTKPNVFEPNQIKICPKLQVTLTFLDYSDHSFHSVKDWRKWKERERRNDR